MSCTCPTSTHKCQYRGHGVPSHRKLAAEPWSGKSRELPRRSWQPRGSARIGASLCPLQLDKCRTASTGSQISLPRHRLPADITAVKAFRPFDALGCRIGARLCLGDGLAQRADVEHAPTIGEDRAVLHDGAGMKDL